VANDEEVLNSDTALTNLVERLIELPPDDFTAVVAAAKLCRRFEEGNRSKRGQ